MVYKAPKSQKESGRIGWWSGWWSGGPGVCSINGNLAYRLTERLVWCWCAAQRSAIGVVINPEMRWELSDVAAMGWRARRLQRQQLLQRLAPRTSLCCRPDPALTVSADDATRLRYTRCTVNNQPPHPANGAAPKRRPAHTRFLFIPRTTSVDR